ncbi:MAG: hypothetical protein NZ932_04105 [Candidatus Bathyarchaeota archaeon]|nr:hypothetical protein [Candidatus Bathyarchaeota archaeon]MDW8022347.1 hypothetical protein [Nitrososphaerota archaeon]
MSRPLRPMHVYIAVLITSVVLGASITLLSEFFYSETGVGYEDFGFPLPWKRVYGGVTPKINFENLLADIIIWMTVVSVLLLLVFRFGFGWKPR